MPEDRSSASVTRDMLARIPETIDTREGSVAHHIVGAVGWDSAELYRAVEQEHKLVLLPTATGEYLDAWGWTVGLERLPASPAVYRFGYEGTEEPPLNERFFYDGLYFRLRRMLLQEEIETPTGPAYRDDLILVLESEGVGPALNNIMPQTPAIPVHSIRGLSAAWFGELLQPGVAQETDDPYHERIHQKLAGPAENGNKAHYRLWCESVVGVGRAKIIPLFAGENTVLAVLYDPDGNPVTDAVAQLVQQYIDPITEGITREWEGQTVVVGDGRGDGKANIGAHFLAIPAGATDVSVSFNALLKEGCTLDMVREEAEAAITKYLAKLSLDSVDDLEPVVRISTIGGLLIDLPSLIDYENLTINGDSRNVRVPMHCAPILQEVDVHALV